jgi:general stress protein 26
MTRPELLQFMQSQRWAVQASVSHDSAPQAALIGFAVTEDFELVFDTLGSSRKCANLRSNSLAALVIGGWSQGDERTVQCEGLVDFPAGEDLRRLQSVYFSVFPDGRERQSWPGLTYIRVVPTWIRYSDYRLAPPEIQEFHFPEIASA